MKLRVGCELQYEFPQPTPVILLLNVHFTRVSDLATPLSANLTETPAPLGITVGRWR